MTAAGPVPGRLRVAIVAANTFEYESRLLKTALTLAEDGHAVTVVAFAGPGLPAAATLAERVELRRVVLDRRIASGLRPLPAPLRSAIVRAAGLARGAEGLPAATAGGGDRLRAPLRRGLEILATVRRGGSWAAAVAAAAPDAEVVHAKALIALPVARAAVRRTAGRRGRFVYDVADLHTESARLVKLPAALRALVRWRERGWVRQAAGVLAATPSMAGEVARRFGIPPPIVLLNCPPAWHPETPGPIGSERLAAAIGLPAGAERPPIVLYQGAFRVDQGIEELVAATDDPALVATGAVVAFLGFGQLEAWLRAEAARRPGRMVVLPAVPEAELLDWAAGADLAFVGAPPRTLNQRLTLPNKLFQSIMAGVPIVVGEGTEHCRLTTAERIGLCCDVDAPVSIAAAIAELLAAPPAERQVLRARCRMVALEKYSWESARGGLVDLYRRLAGGRAEVGG
ncbi:MAG: glycosyltransferase [Candidatus Limnocylindrales bacterium]